MLHYANCVAVAHMIPVQLGAEVLGLFLHQGFPLCQMFFSLTVSEHNIATEILGTLCKCLVMNILTTY